MPDDFIKQLQLSKQIEQKAKEAAQDRKASEKSLAEAEAELAKIKAKLGNVEEAEKLLAMAREAFKDKDYKRCLAMSEESIKASKSEMVRWVEERFGSTRQLLSVLQESGVNVTDVSALLQKISGPLGRGDLDEAVAASSEAYDRAVGLAKDVVSSLVSEGKKESEVLSERSLDMAEEVAKLNKAESLLSSADYLSAIREAQNSVNSLRGKFRSYYLSRVEEIKRRMMLWPGRGLEKVQMALDNAIARMEAHEIEDALIELGAVEESVNRSIAEAVRAHLDILASRTATVGQMGMFTREVVRTIEEARTVLEQGDLVRAIEVVKVADELLRDLGSELVARELLRSKVQLQIAMTVGADLVPMAKEMESARGFVWQGDFASAVQSVIRARDALEQSISGYQDPAARLMELKLAVAKAESLGLNVADAIRASSLARKAVLQKDYHRSSEMLKDAAREVHNSIHAFYGKQIMMIEMGLATALRMQGDVSLESDNLDQVVAKIRANEYTVVEEELKRLSEGVELIIRDLAERAVEESRKIINEYEGPTDKVGPTAKLAEADMAIAEGKFPEAYDLAVEAVSLLRREESELIGSKFEQAERLLTIMVELECESKMLRSKLERAKELNASGDVAGAIRLTEEVVHYAKDIIKDDVQKEMVKVKKAISISKKKGVDVAEAERTMKEAFDLLGQDRTEAAYERMQESMDKLKEVNRLHHEAYDLIADVRGLINEAAAKGLDVSKIEDRLDGARSLFESGRYKESMDVSRVALLDIERRAAPHILPRIIAEAKEMFALGRKMKIDTTRAENELENAERLVGKGDYEKAIAMVKEARGQIAALMSDALSRDISAARAALEKSETEGKNVASLRLMIEKADGQLEDRQYNEAWRIIELVKSEIDQSTFMDAKASDYVRQAEMGIKDLNEIGMDSPAAQEVLRQARLLQKQGNLTLAIELSKKAFLIAAETAERIVTESVARAEEEAGVKGLSSTEMSTVIDLRERIRNAVTSHRFKEAVILLPSFQRALDDLVTNRKRALSSLSEAESKVPDNNIEALPVHLKEMLMRAKKELEEGSFIDSTATSERFLQEMASIEAMRATRKNEILSIREDLEFISDDRKRREIADLVDSAEAHLSKLELERTSLYLRRARASLMEATGSEVGKCFEDLMLLQKIIDQLGLPRPEQEAQNGQAIKISDIRPKDLEKLRREIGVFINAVATGLNSRLEKVIAKVQEAGEQGRPITASMALIEKARSAISGERFPEAMEAITDAERFIGVPDEVMERFNSGKAELMEVLTNMRSDAIEVDDLVKRLEALEKSLPEGPEDSLNGLISLGAAIREQIENMRPFIDVSVEFIDPPKKGSWGKALVKVRNSGGSTAMHVKVSFGEEVEVKGTSLIDLLPPSGTEVMRAEILPYFSGSKKVPVMARCESMIDRKDMSFESGLEVYVK
ncbi:MAG: hypothetical protein HPY73_02045 [Methanomassiliicoccales archaeon]|nr:MAG: hypothetical protein HPY73_02045 [Methanomassiliicoccales archaeon]